MSEHYPESAIGQSILAWCNKCQRQTMHLIVRHSEHAGRCGPCTEHESQPITKAQLKRKERAEREARNPSLFD